MAALLTKVKARMTIHAHRKMRGLLDGEYASVFQGHSLDFDDLREYSPGDEVRDIDWKATARHTTPLVKRYVAHRRHALALVVDSGANFDAVAASGEPKRELAILLAGMAGYLAVRHGDDVMLVHGDSRAAHASASKGTEAHLEQLLRRILAGGANAAGSRITTQLAWVADHLRGRRLVMVIADEAPLTDLDQQLLRRLAAQHELLWVTIADADLTSLGGQDGTPFDVLRPDRSGIPDILLGGDDLRREYEAAEAARRSASDSVLKQLGVAHVTVGHSAEALAQLRRLMKRHRNERR
ncbi:DUF58 domain-containing protein [Brevibacterium daeguense]|uniref:DUF58 domain-containing protein n=1 Tax=Brevibacterium daeguense TaxID=909936 RepID=A0ABP8EFZ9_9MICO|nr:DUF58 domain-containing protein [Brevibacterium daeguense]